MKRFLPLLFFLIGIQLVTAQKEAAIWYFGENAGLDFNSGTPVALTNGALFTYEGCASMSDANGNLLLYSDGITIWNRNHQAMPNGTGLLGHPSSSQSGIIIPMPNNPDIYYVFSLDDAGGLDGLRYSVVDMTLDGGLGDVTSDKNVLLYTPISEKITAVEHSNGNAIWIITKAFDTNDFLTYLIDDTGVNPTPVVSSIPISGTSPYYHYVGCMKVSQDGSTLAVAYGENGRLNLHHFDPATGVVYDEVTLMGYFDNTYDNQQVYGVEFSGNGNILYATTRNGVYQFDVSSFDRNTIMASGLLLSQEYLAPSFPFTTFPGALQMAIDGKIYCPLGGRSYLMVINDPDVLGPGCNFVEQGVLLGGPIGRGGLPPFITSLFYVGIEANNFCLGNATEFSIETSSTILSIAWDFGDGNTSTMETPTHTYATAGDYSVSVTVRTATETKTDTKDITIYEMPIANMVTNEEICHDEDSYTFDLSTKNAGILDSQDPSVYSVAYFSSQSDADDDINALSTSLDFDTGNTTVYVRVFNTNNPDCFATTSFDILVKRTPDLLAVPGSTVCDDDNDGMYTFDLSQWDNLVLGHQDPFDVNIGYFSSQADAEADTNPLPTSYTNSAAIETIYFRIENSTYPECYQVGYFQLEVIDGVVANRPTDLEYCDDNNDGQAVLDLTQAESEIIGSQNAASMNISYHETQADADTGTNAVSSSDYLSTSYQNTIYVRVVNTADSSCYDTTSLQLNIFDTPVAPTITDWSVCDDDNDGQYLFDLSEKNTEILEGISGASLAYYETQQDAELNQNSIGGSYQNVSNPQTAYFRLENLNNPNCYDVGSFELQVFDSPMANQPTDIIACDINETGVRTFDLSIKDSEVLNGQDPTLYSVNYFKNQTDAGTGQNALPKVSYSNSVMEETLFARIQGNTVESCYDLTSFRIIVNPLPQPSLEETYVICPDSPELVINGGDFDDWSWQNNEGIEIGAEQYLTITELGDYQLVVTQVTNGVNCENTMSFQVLSSGAPEDFEVDIEGFADMTRLEVYATGTGDFEYSLNGTDFQDDNRFEVFPGEYTVYVRDKLLCRTISKPITAMGYQKFFTPNGDDTNDYWNIIGVDNYPESQLYIYDRYGKLLVQVNPSGQGWDGTHNGIRLPSSDYWFRYIYDNGKVFTGHFSLKR